METAAVPAGSTRPGPLAALALVAVLPAPVVLRFDGESAWLTSFVFACGLAVVLLIGRQTLGVAQTLVLAIATWSALAFSYVVVFLFGVADLIGSCNSHVSHPWSPLTFGATAVVYAVIAFWLLRKGWWWGLPLAVLLAFVFGFILVYALPGVPNPSNCSD